MSDPIEDALIAQVGSNPTQSTTLDPVESALLAKIKSDSAQSPIQSAVKPETNKWDSILHSGASLADTV